MKDFNLMLHGVSLTLAILVALQSSQSSKTHQSARFLLFWSLAVAIFIIEKVLIAKFGLMALQFTLLITPLIPALYWLFCASLFDDDFKLKTWHIALAFCAVLSSNLAFYLDAYVGNGLSQSSMRFFHKGTHLIIIILSVFAIGKDWKEDLNKKRYKLRFFCLGIGAFYIFSVIFFNMFTREFKLVEHSQNFFNNIASLFFLIFLNILLVKDGSHFFASLKTIPKPYPDQFAKIKDPRVERIHTLILEKKLFQKEDFSLEDLAKIAKIPQYKLRSIINTSLGYSNFRNFINYYRVEEAARLLKEPSNDDKILSIAFSVGFSSLAPFNRAFKLQYGKTPSEFRKN